MSLEIVGAVQYAKRLPCLVNNGNSFQSLTDGGEDIEWNDLTAWLRIESFVYQKSFWTSSIEGVESLEFAASEQISRLPSDKKEKVFSLCLFRFEIKNF